MTGGDGVITSGSDFGFTSGAGDSGPGSSADGLRGFFVSVGVVRVGNTGGVFFGVVGVERDGSSGGFWEPGVDVAPRGGR